MPDWEAFVCSQLTDLTLAPEERTDVIAELATHLDETFEELRRKGLSEEDAARRARNEVQDWHDLQRRIQTARTKEDTMPKRIAQLWLPGLLSFVLSMGFLALFQIFGPKPWILAWGGHKPVVMFYIPWLLLLPLVGAMGAYLSHRAGGSQRAVLSSIVFSVLPFLAAILVVLPVSLIFEHFIAHNVAPMALLMALPGWVFAPGAALLAGGLPVQFLLSRRLTSRRVASN